MVALAVPMAAPKAMVEVGPPLFCKVPRLRAALVTLVAHESPAWVTRLFAAVEGVIKFTVPVPVPA